MTGMVQKPGEKNINSRVIKKRKELLAKPFSFFVKTRSTIKSYYQFLVTTIFLATKLPV